MKLIQNAKHVARKIRFLSRPREKYSGELGHTIFLRVNQLSLRQTPKAIRLLRQSAEEFSRAGKHFTAAALLSDAARRYLKWDSRRYEKQARTLFRRAGVENILDMCQDYFVKGNRFDEDPATHRKIHFVPQSLQNAQQNFERAGNPEQGFAVMELITGKRGFVDYLKEFHPAEYRRFVAAPDRMNTAARNKAKNKSSGKNSQ